MSTSPLSPQEIRAAAAVHQELGPEYSDVVVESYPVSYYRRREHSIRQTGRWAP
jgi:hypothetical protein